MKELRRNKRAKLVDIGESCSLSDLKRNGYERAERYKDSHQLDMILHIYLTIPGPPNPDLIGVLILASSIVTRKKSKRYLLRPGGYRLSSGSGGFPKSSWPVGISTGY
jgi:hypothetical protein